MGRPTTDESMSSNDDDNGPSKLSNPTTTNKTNESSFERFLIGPDLNESRSPFDKKLYRQIMLPNGLRVVLISDVVAMAQSQNMGGLYPNDDDDDDDDEEEEEDDDDEEAKDPIHPDNNDSDNDDDTHDTDTTTTTTPPSAGGLREAAAAMVVGVGSMYDPVDCQGMAHFLEHLLFMGSSKYPQENAYDSYMSKHGGHDNAYTELEYTVFYFEIPQEYLVTGTGPSALDMFAQFFTSPLLLESSVERELNAIDSEFQLAKNADSCRVQQLMSYTCCGGAGAGDDGKELIDPEHHPFSKFCWGNLKSLKEIPESKNIDTMKMLRDFYNQYYYASNMRLVVIGAYTLDVLQDHVVKSFSDIPAVPRTPTPSTTTDSTTTNGATTPSNGTTTVGSNPTFSWEDTYVSPMATVGKPFLEPSLKKVYYIAPVKDRHGLSVCWQIPPQMENWKSKPCDYLAHLLGHEAEGSLLASLKAKSWVTACSAGVGSEGFENASSHALFMVAFTLSEQGVANWKSIISELYQYVGMLRYHCEQGLPKWIFEELQSIQEIAHKYSDEPSPGTLVETFADELAPHFRLPPERLLDGSALLFEYDPDAIKTLIDTYFTPQNARVDFASTTFGRSADYENAADTEIEADPSPQNLNMNSVELVVLEPSNEQFDPSGIPPQREPMFGTFFWCQELASSMIQEWEDLAKPQLPPSTSTLHLPPVNPYVPTNLGLKPLPPSDCLHPLLNCSLKLQITVGKKKQWFPATVTRFNSIKNEILLSYEDENEKWHKVDVEPSELTPSLLASDYEGTMDDKKIKYRIVALAMEGEGAVRKFGDESDYDVEDGKGFPAIPPALPEARLPQLICNSQVLKLWHLQDRTFRRPIAELRLQLHCGEANKTPLHAACADVLVYLVSDSLTETAYLASVCELGSSLSSNDGGLSIRVHGFNDKLLDLFSKMLGTLLSFRGRSGSDGLPNVIRDGRFSACLEVFRRGCTNSGLQASKLSKDVRIRCLRATTWSSHQKLDAVKDINEAIFTETVSSVLSKIGIEALYHGNVDVADAQRAQREILTLVEATGGGGLPRKKYPQQYVTRVPAAAMTSLVIPGKDLSDQNTSVEMYVQVGKDNTVDRVMTNLLSEIMYEPLYDQLRTKDQFGYQVSCDSRWTNGIIGMQFVVVTSSKTATQAVERIERFLREFRKELQDMSKEDFMEHLNGLAKQKLEMFNSMSEETGHLWSEIRDGRYEWQSNREEALCLRSITHEQVLKAYDEWLNPDNGKDGKRQIFVVQVVSSEGPASDGRPDVDPANFGNYIDDQVRAFHKLCKNQTWGKVY